MICNKCGNAVEHDVYFCEKCGNRVRKETVQIDKSQLKGMALWEENYLFGTVGALLGSAAGVLIYYQWYMFFSYQFLLPVPGLLMGLLTAGGYWWLGKRLKAVGTVISAVPLVWGIAELAGLKHPEIPGANGDLDTNYEGKVDAAIAALKNGDDFAAIHVEAPDEMTHAGKLPEKLEAIRRLDERVIKPLLERLPALGDFRILLLSERRSRTYAAAMTTGMVTCIGAQPIATAMQRVPYPT